MTKKISITILILVFLAAGLLWLNKDDLVNLLFLPGESSLSSGINLNNIKNQKEKNYQKTNIKTVSQNLSIPWEIVFLPDDTMLITERPGNLVRLSPEQEKRIEIEGVEHAGEGGLLGAAIHPDFSENSWLYLYLTTKTENGLINRVERYRFDLEKNELSQKEEIISNIPGASYHDGGRIAFGPDKYLYITTGDAGQTQLAQDKNSLAGKILRLKNDGSVPEDNPFNNPIYSYGHRNPQGLAWDDKGSLWATEHGPSGMNSGFDEINLIEKGKNYGWPEITGKEKREGMASPIIQSGSEDTWAPAALEIINNKIFFSGLRGSSLYTGDIIDKNIENLKANFTNDWGRLRVCKYGPDSWLYLATSNTDGRGNPKENDDKIIKINPDIIN